MIIDLVQIGNSKGIRLPSSILKQCKIKGKIDLKVEDDKIVIKAIDIPRYGWEDSFKKMHKNGDDKMIIDDFLHVDSEEWEWK